MILRLRSFRRSSSAWRVRIGLGLKGLSYQYRAVDLGAGQQHQAPHRARSPFGHGPVLDAPGLADCYLVPQLGTARRLEVDLAPYPTLLRVEQACNALPAFQSALPERQPDAPGA